jgi:hypothetical protein
MVYCASTSLCGYLELAYISLLHVYNLALYVVAQLPGPGSQDTCASESLSRAFAITWSISFQGFLASNVCARLPGPGATALSRLCAVTLTWTRYTTVG